MHFKEPVVCSLIQLPDSGIFFFFPMYSTGKVGIVLLTSTLQSDLRWPAQVDSY